MTEQTEQVGQVEQGNSGNECHGLYWDFPKAPECKKCAGQQSCFHEFSQVTFPEALTRLGPDATLEQLAQDLDISEEAVLVTKNEVSKAPPVNRELQPERVEKSGAGELVQDEDVMDLAEADEMEDELDGVSEPGGPEILESSGLEPEPELEPESEPDLEPEPPPETEMVARKKKAAKKKAAKKAPAKKKAAAKKKAPGKKKTTKKAPPVAASEAQDPTPAESAKTAMGSAGTKARAKTASRAKGQAGPSKTGSGTKGKKRPPAKKPVKVARRDSARVDDPWGKHTWEKRWRRERQNPWVKKLRPGMKIQREYPKGGEIHEVVILKRYYRYQGQDYPTLYSIVKEITGTKEAPRQLDKAGRRPDGTRQLCNWSAPRFFALPVLFRRP
jgi:hypothetical protein